MTTEELMKEDRVKFVTLAVELGVNRHTVARWADLGFQGVKLETYRIGSKKCTTRQAVARFLAKTNEGTLWKGELPCCGR